MLAAVAVPVLIAPNVPEPLVQALGGLVNKASDSARFFTWCITPLKSKKIVVTKLVTFNKTSEFLSIPYIKPSNTFQLNRCSLFIYEGLASGTTAYKKSADKLNAQILALPLLEHSYCRV